MRVGIGHRGTRMPDVRLDQEVGHTTKPHRSTGGVPETVEHEIALFAFIFGDLDRLESIVERIENAPIVRIRLASIGGVEDEIVVLLERRALLNSRGIVTVIGPGLRIVRERTVRKDK